MKRQIGEKERKKKQIQYVIDVIESGGAATQRITNSNGIETFMTHHEERNEPDR